MAKLLTVVVVMAAAANAAAQSRQPDFYLDILAYPLKRPLTSARESVMGGGLMSVPARRGPMRVEGLRIELVSLDKTYYEVGDLVIYEVDIENATREPVVLPWSPDVYLFPIKEQESMPEYRNAGILLEVQSRRDGRQLGWLGIQSLHGSEDKYWTLQKLDPEKKARIRIPGRWHSSDAENAAILGDAAGEVQVIARLNLRLPTETFFVKSVNHIDMNVVPWQARH